MTQPVIDVWASILRAVPTAKLLLKDKQFANSDRILETMARFGDVSSRLLFGGVTGHIQHLEAYGRVDVALDPWPAGGGVTTLEALWMGVPTITMMGDRPSCRASASIMTVAGLAEWVAHTQGYYIALAMTALEDLQEQRLTMRARMESTALANTVQYIQAVEYAYLTMWARRRSSTLPPPSSARPAAGS